ncbi:glycine oxidase ThiO [Thalassotalea hakodatensis]|uniref:glycine oxidase ThiO n=1 Tax=Thalassotalea hakodatensis TaxID=3030492 RepID=UPI00257299EF|nr:glycine oxidase ThiO [Thalassotalea hakodatensis]
MLPNKHQSEHMAEIAIVGAGLMGRLAAVSLAREGHKVTLIDKDDINGTNSAAYAAAGMLTPLGEAMHCDANIVEMGFISLALWPTLLSNLASYTYFQQQGSIMVAHEQDHSELLRYKRFLQQHYANHAVQELDRQRLVNLEPELSRHFNQGLFLPEEGQLGNRKLLLALEEEIKTLAVEWLTVSNVSAIKQVNNCVELTINDEQRTVELVIDCRGTGARQAVAQQAMPLNDLRAVRGELFQLFAPDVNIQRPVRLMHPRYQLYIAPKTHGYFVVGATEIESDDSSPMTVRSAMELLSAAYSVHSGFAEANIRQHISQLRPAFSDNQPKISIDNKVIQINGLYRHGFLIAPVVLAQLLSAVNATLSSEQSVHSSYQHLLPVNFSHEYIH